MQKELFARQRLKTYKRKPKAADRREQVAALIRFYQDRRPKAKGEGLSGSLVGSHKDRAAAVRRVRSIFQKPS